MEEKDTFLPIEFRDLLPEQLASLRKFTVSRITYWADHDLLSEHPRMLPILNAWQHWSTDDKCSLFIKKMTETDRGLIIFLTAILSEAITQAMTHYVVNPEWKSYLQDIDVFIPPRALENHAKILFEDQHFEQLREREQLALMIFLDLLKANTKKIIPDTSG
jgi:hypothetical protein